MNYKNQDTRQSSLFKSLINLKWFLAGHTQKMMFNDASFDEIVKDLTTHCKGILLVKTLFFKMNTAVTDNN